MRLTPQAYFVFCLIIAAAIIVLKPIYTKSYANMPNAFAPTHITIATQSPCEAYELLASTNKIALDYDKTQEPFRFYTITDYAHTRPLESKKPDSSSHICALARNAITAPLTSLKLRANASDMEKIAFVALAMGSESFYIPRDSVLGNHSLDLANFGGSQTSSLVSPPKFTKSYESTTATPRILDSSTTASSSLRDTAPAVSWQSISAQADSKKAQNREALESTFEKTAENTNADSRATDITLDLSTYKLNATSEILNLYKSPCTFLGWLYYFLSPPFLLLWLMCVWTFIALKPTHPKGKIPARTYQELGVLVLLLLLALILRLYHYDSFGLWGDELYSVGVVGYPDGDFSSVFNDPGNPPFYNFLLKLWLHCFGYTSAAARGLSVVIGTMGVGGIYLLLRDHACENSALGNHSSDFVDFLKKHRLTPSGVSCFKATADHKSSSALKSTKSPTSTTAIPRILEEEKGAGRENSASSSLRALLRKAWQSISAQADSKKAQNREALESTFLQKVDSSGTAISPLLRAKGEAKQGAAAVSLVIHKDKLESSMDCHATATALARNDRKNAEILSTPQARANLDSSKSPSDSKILDEKCGLQGKSQGSYLSGNDCRDFSPLPHFSLKAESPQAQKPTPTPLIGAFFYAISFVAIGAAHEVRGYVLELALLPLVFYFLLHFLKNPKLSNALGYVLLGAMVCNTHYFGAVMIAAGFIASAIWLWQATELSSNQKRRRLVALLLLDMLIASSLVPFFAITAYTQALSNTSFNTWIPAPSLNGLLQFLPQAFGSSSGAFVFLVLFMLTPLLKNRFLNFCAIVITLGVLLPFIASFVRPIYYPKYAIYATYAFMLALCSVGIVLVARRLAGAQASYLIAFGVCALSISLLDHKIQPIGVGDNARAKFAFITQDSSNEAKKSSINPRIYIIDLHTAMTTKQRQYEVYGCKPRAEFLRIGVPELVQRHFHTGDILYLDGYFVEEDTLQDLLETFASKGARIYPIPFGIQEERDLRESQDRIYKVRF
ncbi:hypothetical protein [Helicobacter canis]|uniref:3-oxoacyl-(Acyl carrier protein) synthase III n=1 Tax=Helicobacter canis TaxID=29419 RepID=A0A377J6B8_9HELI|nr:hypothetical protein [Helicobacter canis]STO98037.1 3-oxoacyl-(acyl carrier protein) synthase III [Helicobacter canis]